MRMAEQGRQEVERNQGPRIGPKGMAQWSRSIHPECTSQKRMMRLRLLRHRQTLEGAQLPYFQQIQRCRPDGVSGALSSPAQQDLLQLGRTTILTSLDQLQHNGF